MGQYNAGILTTAGQQLITQALAGDGIISFPLAKTSSWAIPAGTNIQALTDLQDIQQTVTPGTAQIFNGTMIQVQALFSNANQGSEVTEAYLVQTVGLWAQITGGEPTLFSVYQATTPDQMPAYAGKAPSSLIYTLQATVQQASQLTVQVNPAGAATAVDIQNLQNQIFQNRPSYNFLVNPFFQYNGRNQQSYTAQAWTVDGWFSPSGSATITLSGGVTVTNAIAVAQPIQQYEQLFGKQATFSVKDADAIYTVTATMPNSAQGTDAQIAAQATPWGDIAIWNISSLSAFAVVISVSSAATLEAAKLELGATSTLAADLAQGQDEAVEQLRLDLYDLDPGRPAWVLTQNENLLDNWYFVGGGSQQSGGQLPVNQMGKTSYSGTNQYTIDRWKISPIISVQTVGTLTIQSTGVHLENESGKSLYFNQIIPDALSSALNGKTVTLSFLVSDVSGTWAISEYSKSGKLFSSPGLIDCTFLWDDAVDVKRVQLWSVLNAAGSITVSAAKLELGTKSTLARLVDGGWVLNDPPPNFQQELAKCQYYQRFIRANGAYSPFWVGSSSSDAVFFRAYGVQMRITPTLTTSGNFLLRGNGGTMLLSGNTWNVIGANEPTISASSLSEITASQIYQLLSNNDTDAYILLDANL